MKIIPISDLHGYLPEINENFDVLVISGDIVDMYYQKSMIKSIVWFNREFVPWAMNLNCKRVIIIGGNHDFFFQMIVNDYFKHRNVQYTKEFKEMMSASIIRDELMLPPKIVYLQDSGYTFMDKTFYGTPWCPNLEKWAFHKDSDSLNDVFEKIPDNVDVLLTHSPGKGVNDTATVLDEICGMEYGSVELTNAVERKSPKYWFVGHVHSGNHELTCFKGIKVANVSLRDHNDLPVYGYKIYDI